MQVGMTRSANAEQATAEPLVMRRRAPTELVSADYFTEEVRRELVEEHGLARLAQRITDQLDSAPITLADGAEIPVRVVWARPITARGLELSAAQRAQLAACTDIDQLDAWLTQAVTATHTDELFS